MRYKQAGRAITWVALLGLLVAGVWYTGIQTRHIQSIGQLMPKASPTFTATEEQIKAERGTFARLAKELKPSVVNIAVQKLVTSQGSSPDELMRRFFSGDLNVNPKPQPVRGQGSGVIISPDGYIITNNHVVSGASEVRVTLDDGSEYSATVVGTDSKTDLALVKVDARKPLPAARLGDSDALDVGDWVMAIGNPFGLDETVTVGVLSGKGRRIGEGPYDDFLQTDASINPGNSGGPLFNIKAEVVGINTAIIQGGQGIGFSIPINMAKDIVAQLKASGHVVRGFIGVGIQPLTPKLRRALGLSEDLKGALVSSVVPNSPAQKAGMEISDVVTSLNGKPVTSDRELLAQVARLPVDSEAQLTVVRSGRSKNLAVKVVRRPDEDVSSTNPRPQSSKSLGPLGVQVQDLTPELAQQLGTNTAEGAVILGVESGSAAEQAGLKAGDIVRKVGNQPIHSAAEFVAAWNQARGHGQQVALLIERGGSTVFVVVES